MTGTKTDALLSELERCRQALIAYQKRAVKGDASSTKEHASAYRATLDLGRLLVKWRQESPRYDGEK